MHRRFGYLMAFETPPTDAQNVKSHVRLLDKSKFRWGWSQQEAFFTLPNQSTVPNLMVLPSCAKCRACRLFDILGNKFADLERGKTKACEDCADWTVNDRTAKRLQFAAHDHYPKRCAKGTPIDPPSGRPVPLPTTKSADGKEDVPIMEFQPLKFAEMKMACRFAVWNGTRPNRKERWTK